MKVILVLLALIAGFLAGGLIGSGTVPAGAGLAAGATVFLWGVGGAVSFLLLSILVAARRPASDVRIAVMTLVIVIGACLFLLAGRAAAAHAAAPAVAPVMAPVAAPVKAPAGDLPAAAARYPRLQRSELPAGLGVLVVAPVPGSRLQFHATPGIGQQPGDDAPVAEVRFGSGIPSVDILEAPPWLVPEHLKMDYEIFHLRVLTLTPSWAEVVGNSTTGETWWVARTGGQFVAWPEFLVNASAVFPFGEIRIHARPLDDSPVLAATTSSLEPLAVRGDWLKVSISTLADRMPPEGWLRWRDGERLLVGYKPLG